MQFRSKVDWWLGALLALLPLATLLGLYTSLSHGSLSGLFGVVLVVALYGGLVFPMRYELGDDALTIRFGLVRKRIPYREIRRVTPTRNPLSSPALSLDRLHVDTGNPLGPNISPADKAGFLRELAARAPHLKVQGDALVPA